MPNKAADIPGPGLQVSSFEGSVRLDAAAGCIISCYLDSCGWWGGNGGRVRKVPMRAALLVMPPATKKQAKKYGVWVYKRSIATGCQPQIEAIGCQVGNARR